MADVGIEQLKEDIQSNINTNNNQEITGAVLQGQLIDTVDTLKGYTDDHVSVSQNTQTLKIGGEEVGALGGIYEKTNIQFLAVWIDAKKKLILGVEQDDNIFFGAGCPRQVKDYIKEQLGSYTKEQYGDIVTFLGGLIEGETLSTLLNGKVDKIDGRELIPSQYIQEENNPEYIEVETDSNKKLLSGRKKNGKKVEHIGFETPNFKIGGTSYNEIQDPEGKLELSLDGKRKVLSYRDADGKLHETVGIDTESVQAKNIVSESLEANNADIDNLRVDSVEMSEQGLKNLASELNVRDLPPEWYEGYDVCICGGGAAGVFAAYALKEKVQEYGLKVCIIEKQPYLGGTHTQAFVASLAPTPAPLSLDAIITAQIKKGKAAICSGEHSPFTFAHSLEIDQKWTYGSYWINIDPYAMSEKYYEDLKDFIDIFTSDYVTSVEISNGQILSVTTHGGKTIYANNFIDCTGNDDLIRLSNGRLVYGGDAQDRYEDEFGFIEEHSYTSNYDFCNCATVVYRVRKGLEDLSHVSAAYTNHAAYFKYMNNKQMVYMNTVNYIDGDSGMKVITQGADAVYAAMSPEMIRQWKTIKNGELTTPAYSDILDGLPSTYKFDTVAPMLGVRETYRAICERMLNENSLYVQVTDTETASDNLDKTIAVGNYIVDLLNDPYITQAQRDYIDSHKAAFYPVPYGCLIPKTYTNLLVASRGAGFTHIGASSFRLTKDMMQIGWAAGWAAFYKIEKELSDFRNVDIDDLRTDDYANIQGMLDRLLH